MENVALKSQKQSVAEYLLNKTDFEIIRTDDNNYLFMADSLRFFKITNPKIEEYLRISSSENISKVLLSEEEIAQIGTFLMQDEKAMEAETPDLDYGSLTLNITNGCNLACKYCFANTNAKNFQTMTFEIAQKAIDNMLTQKRELDEYTIFYFGGEPLLKKELLRQISEYAQQEIAVKRRKKLKFLINTNATLIDEQALSLFKEYSFKVTVSIDGPKEIHDANRIYSNGKGSYNKVEKCIQLLKKNTITTQLRPTFSPKLKNLTAAFDFFEKQELPYGYAFSHTTNYQSDLHDTYFNEQQMEETNNEFRAVMDYFVEKIKRKEKIFCAELMRKANLIHYKAKRTHLCEAGRKSVAVDEMGNYFACQTMIPHRHAAIGNVYSNLNDAKRHQYMAKDISQITLCDNCTIRGLCVGGCEVERMNFEDNVLLHKQMCDLFRLEWNNILYFYAKSMNFL